LELSYYWVRFSILTIGIISGAVWANEELIELGSQRNVGIDHMVSVCYLSTFSFAKRLARAKAAALGSCGFFVI
jgi:hypothetical protein